MRCITGFARIAPLLRCVAQRRVLSARWCGGGAPIAFPRASHDAPPAVDVGSVSPYDAPEAFLLRLSGREAFADAAWLRHSTALDFEVERCGVVFRDYTVKDMDDPADEELRTVVAELLFATDYAEGNIPPSIMTMRFANSVQVSDEHIVQLGARLHPAQRAYLLQCTSLHTRRRDVYIIPDPLWLSVWAETLIDALPLLDGEPPKEGNHLTSFPHLGPHHDVYVVELRFLRAMRSALALKGRYPYIFLAQRFTRVVDDFRPELFQDNPMPWMGSSQSALVCIADDVKSSSEEKKAKLLERGVIPHPMQVDQTAALRYRTGHDATRSSLLTDGFLQQSWWDGLLPFGWALVREGCPYQRFRTLMGLLGTSVGEDEVTAVPIIVALSSRTASRPSSVLCRNQTLATDVTDTRIDKPTTVCIALSNQKTEMVTLSFGCIPWYERQPVYVASRRKRGQVIPFWQSMKPFLNWFFQVRRSKAGFTDTPGIRPLRRARYACLRDFDQHSANTQELGELLDQNYEGEVAQVLVNLFGDGAAFRKTVRCFGSISNALSGHHRVLRKVALLACLRSRLRTSKKAKLQRTEPTWTGIVTDKELSWVGRQYIPPLRLVYIPNWCPDEVKLAVKALGSRKGVPAAILRKAEADGIPGTVLQLTGMKVSRVLALTAFETWMTSALEFVVFAKHPLLSLGAGEDAILKVFRHVSPDDYRIQGTPLWSWRFNSGRWSKMLSYGEGAAYIESSKALYALLVRMNMGGRLRKGDLATVDTWLALRMKFSLKMISIAASEGNVHRRQGANKELLEWMPMEGARNVYQGLEPAGPEVGTELLECIAAGKVIPSRHVLSGRQQGRRGLTVARCWRYLRAVTSHLVRIEPDRRKKYFGPAEEAVRDYVARLDIPSHLLLQKRSDLSPAMQRRLSWLPEVYQTLCRIHETREPVADSIIEKHRRMISRTLTNVQTRSLPNWSRMPFIGQPNQELRRAVTQLVSTFPAVKKMTLSALTKASRAGLFADMGPASPRQVQALIRNDLRSLADFSATKLWREWLYSILRQDSSGHLCPVVKAVRRLELDETWPIQATKAEVKAVYGMLSQVMKGEIAPDDVRQVDATDVTVTSVRTLRWAVEGMVERMPLVGAPSVHHIKLFADLCRIDPRNQGKFQPSIQRRRAKASAYPEAGSKEGFLMMPSVRMGERNCIKWKKHATVMADEAGLALSIEQCLSYAVEGRKHYISGFQLRGQYEVNEAVEKFMTTWHPVAPFRDWLLDVVQHGSAGPRVWMHGKLVHGMTAHLTAAQVSSMTDDELIDVYNKLALALYTAVTGATDEKVCVLDFVRTDPSTQNMTITQTSHDVSGPAMFSNRLPHVSFGNGRSVPPVLVRVILEAHAIFGNTVNPRSSSSTATRSIHRSSEKTFAMLVMRMLWDQGIPASQRQICDLFDGSSTWDDIAAQMTFSTDAEALFVQWAVDLRESRGECLLRRRVVFGPEVDMYDDVLDAFPSPPRDWTPFEIRVAYSRCAQASPGPHTAQCGLLLAPRPASLRSGVTSDEMTFFSAAHRHVFGVPPMPHLGSPLSREHAELLFDSRFMHSSKRWYTAMNCRFLPGTFEQAVALAASRDKAVGTRHFREWLKVIVYDYVPGDDSHALVKAVHQMNLRDDLDEATDEVLQHVFSRLLPIFTARATGGRPVRNLAKSAPTEGAAVSGDASRLVVASFVTDDSLVEAPLGDVLVALAEEDTGEPGASEEDLLAALVDADADTSTALP